jgi:ABC-type transport system involved in multi-copper enzyme maturation permease subunit
VSVKNYAQRISDYHQEVQTYKEQAEGRVHGHFQAEGIHPPSPLSIFSQGLDNRMPYKVKTSRDGQYTIEYATPDRKEDLMGKIDFAYIVVIVLSILALVFTFNAISGDKESGVFRAVLSNPVLRRQILMTKLIGNYIVFSIPFLFSMLIALLVIYYSNLIPIFSTKIFPSILVIIGISMLFLFALFNLGLWMSAFARSSTLSINILILIWILLGLVIPKVSPIISEAIYPVESTSVFEVKKKSIYQNMIREQEKEEGELYESIRTRLRPETSGISSDWTDINTEYDEQVAPIREKWELAIASEIDKLTVDYNLRCKKQNRIAKIISSLSIVNSANNLMAEFSATGYSEADNFLNQAKQFQNNVQQNLYDKFVYKIYKTGGSTMSQMSAVGEFDANKAPVPLLDNYKHVSLSEAFQQNWSDIMLIGFYCLLFFVAAFVCFIRFDVR